MLLFSKDVYCFFFILYTLSHKHDTNPKSYDTYDSGQAVWHSKKNTQITTTINLFFK